MNFFLCLEDTTMEESEELHRADVNLQTAEIPYGQSVGK
jgi:hypothetical protein